jgi:hypothetical protein
MQRIDEMKFEFPDDFPELAKDLVNQLLREEPSERLGADDIENLKAHEFFAGTFPCSLFSIGNESSGTLLKYNNHMRCSIQAIERIMQLPTCLCSVSCHADQQSSVPVQPRMRFRTLSLLLCPGFLPITSYGLMFRCLKNS